MVSLGNVGGNSFEFRGSLQQRVVQTGVELRFDFALDARDRFLQFQESLSSLGSQDL